MIPATQRILNRNVSPPNDWSRHTVAILASGPSLTDDQVAYVKGKENTRVIAVNNTYLKAPWADVIYAGDYLWWKVHATRVQGMGLHRRLWTQDHGAAERHKLNRVKGVNKEGLGVNCVHMGGNSGYQALNLAFLWGTKKIVLLGFDMKVDAEGRKHWHPDHADPLVQGQTFDAWIKRFEQLAKDLKARRVEVLNCTPDSALPWFPMAKLEETL